MKTKALMIILVAAGLVLGGLSTARAELKCPRNVITWVVPFGAGGGTDRWARILSSASFDAFGMAMHVRNKPGASGVVGWKFLLSQPANGCTILQASPTPVIALLQEEKPPVQLDQVKIFAIVSAFRSVLMAAPGKPYSTLEGLKKYAKANPGKLTIGATQSHLLGQAFFFNQLGLKFTYVPYPSTGKGVSDFLGGHTDLAAVTASSVKGLVPKRASIVVNTSEMPLGKAFKNIKGVPNAKSLGLEGLSFIRWLGVHPDTPDAIADELSVKTAALLKNKSVKRLIAKIGEEIIFSPRRSAEAQYQKMVKNMKSAVALLKKK